MYQIINKSASIEFILSATETITIDKRGADVLLQGGYVTVANAESDGAEEESVRLHWTDVSTPIVTSNQELYDVILEFISATYTNVTQFLADGTEGTKITDGVESVDVEISASDIDNLDGKNGLVTNAILHGRLDNDNTRPVRIDDSTHSMTITDYEHHEIHGGSHYFVDDFIADLPINDVYDIRITTPDTTKWGHFTLKIDAESQTIFRLYEDVVINTVGTAMTPRNNNRNFPDASVLAFDAIQNGSIALANADTDISGATQLRALTMGAGKDSGSDARGREIVLRQNTTYTIRLIAETAGYVDYSFNWYEHTDKA